MKAGDEVMLVSNYGMGRKLLNLRREKVKAVHKNGLILIEGTDAKFRQDGHQAGKGNYYNAWRLQVWDDALWQKFQIEQSQIKIANRLYELSEKFSIIARDHEKAAEIWENLPYSVRSLVEREPADG